MVLSFGIGLFNLGFDFWLEVLEFGAQASELDVEAFVRLALAAGVQGL